MNDTTLTLFLCGDVMTGRGIDQILPHPSDPRLYEFVVTSARDYVALAERANGPIPRSVAYEYIWGEARTILAMMHCDANIINLETSITTSRDAQPKGINYRMHPANVPVLASVGVDCCVLSNNHVLDWGVDGLLETLETLSAANIPVAGAGRNLDAARRPAVLSIAETGGRILVFAFGSSDSGIPSEWAAGPTSPGVHWVTDFSDTTVGDIAALVYQTKQPGDVAVASIHWGGNWGYHIPKEHRRFAHALIDRAAIDVVHGHSSHHPKAIEVYRNHPILFGCGELIDDYEGIPGHRQYRSDLVLMYFVTLDRGTGGLLRLGMTPLCLRNFRLEHPSSLDRSWLQRTLDRECRRFGHRVATLDEALVLDWGT